MKICSGWFLISALVVSLIVSADESFAQTAKQPVVAASTDEAVTTEMRRASLLAADRNFSAYSAQNEAAKAFYLFLADDAVYLPEGATTINGKDAIVAFFRQLPANVTLIWQPLSAEVSPDGKMGYTRGTYRLLERSDDKQIIKNGNYVTIWRKQAEGWRVVLDTGSQTKAAAVSSSVKFDRTLHDELLERVKRDQDARTQLMKLPSSQWKDFYERNIRAIDESNTARLQTLIKQHGWLTAELVGADAEHAAFLIVQHSPSAEFQNEMLPHIKAAFEGGELDGQDYALLYDRVQDNAGRKQLYGTQYTEDEQGRISVDVSNLQEPSRVELHRATVGLMPIAEYIKRIEMMKQRAAMPTTKP